MAESQGRVVIVDGEGKRHFFPAGFDPARAASIVKQSSKPAEPKQPGLATIGEQLESKGQHPLAQLGSQVIDAGKGVKAAALSTIYNGGDLIRRGLGMERVIDRPEVQQAITPPDSVGGQIGFYGEQAAEFAIPLSRLAKANAGAGLMKRAATDAAASGAVATVQSGGDPTQTGLAVAGGAVLPFVAKGASATYQAGKRAAAGASEGGIGGAVASAVRNVAPSEPAVMLTQALKPRSSQVNFGGSLTKAVPELKASEAALGKPIEGLDDLMKATKDAKQRIRAQYDQIAGPKRAMGSTVDLSPVAEAMEKSIPSKVKLEDPRKAADIIGKADIYRRSFGLEEAEQLLKETNAELDAFYDKFPMAQRKALASNPEVAHLVAQGKALRDAIYKTLDDPAQGGAARELNRRYGALLDVESEATRRLNVAARQQPESLSEQLSGARAAGDIAKGAWRLAHGDLTGAADIASGHATRQTAKFLKDQQTTDALIKRAFAGFKGQPVPVPMPKARPIAGYLDEAPIVTPPPADTSYARGVPAQYGASSRKALPAGRPPIVPPVNDPSGARGVAAEFVLERMPDGTVRRVYLSGPSAAGGRR